MRFLITGSSGFIGSHLTTELLNNGHDVFGMDRHPRVRDIPSVGGEINLSNFLYAMSKYEPDRVVHLAASVGRENCEHDKRDTIRNNVELTTMIAETCAEYRIPLTYASTSEIYGDHEGGGHKPISEDAAGDREPKNLYGLTKWWGEQACRLYAPVGLQVIRPTMPYGPGVPPGPGRRALDNFLWQAHHRKPITVHMGSRRSWVWIEDLVRGIRMVLESGGKGEWNVGRDDDLKSMAQCAEIACMVTGAPLDLISIRGVPSDVTAVKNLSVDRLRRLGWDPTVDFREGMERLYAWIELFDENGEMTVG